MGESVLTPLSVLEEAVARGAARLDEVEPGWFLRIDVERIEPACPDHSITGQLFGPDVRDQMIRVGINFDAAKPWKPSIDFAELGFGVLTTDAVPVPEEIQEKMRAISAELSAVVGKDLSGVARVPEVIPVPRDEVTMQGEAFALTYIWENTVKARIR